MPIYEPLFNTLLSSENRMHKKVVVHVDTGIREGAILRRYMDLPKYLDMLRSSTVYVSRVDGFTDKLEGVLTPSIRARIIKAYSDGQIHYDADTFIRRLRENIYVSCWTLSAHDNMALWKLYSSASTGIAITTTKEQLIRSCAEWAAEECVQIFKVEYIDHLKNPDMIIGSYSDPLRFKHKAYKYETEIRVVISRAGTKMNNQNPKGIRLPINLDTLVRSVVVAPEAGSWFYDLVSDVTSKYRLCVPVRKSKLAYVGSELNKQLNSDR